MEELLARFVAAFKRGIEGELAAMHESADAFEIALARGEDLGTCEEISAVYLRAACQQIAHR